MFFANHQRGMATALFPLILLLLLFLPRQSFASPMTGSASNGYGTSYGPPSAMYASYQTRCRPNPVYDDRVICDTEYVDDSSPSYSGPCKPFFSGVVFGLGFGIIGGLFYMAGYGGVKIVALGGIGGFGMGYLLCSASLAE